MSEPRAFTEDEMRDKFLNHIHVMVNYWATLPDVDRATGRTMTIKDRCDGVAFSILSTLDGCSMVIPAVDLVFCPHEEDKEYCISEGENWVEPETRVSTSLHEYYCAMRK